MIVSGGTSGQGASEAPRSAAKRHTAGPILPGSVRRCLPKSPGIPSSIRCSYAAAAMPGSPGDWSGDERGESMGATGALEVGEESVGRIRGRSR